MKNGWFDIMTAARERDVWDTCFADNSIPRSAFQENYEIESIVKTIECTIKFYSFVRVLSSLIMKKHFRK